MKNIPLYFMAFFFMSNGVELFAQQLHSLSNLTDFHRLYNPAAQDNLYIIGKKRKKLNFVDLFYREQWVSNNLEGEPRTFGANLILNINDLWSSQIGIISDKAGAISTNRLNLSVRRQLLQNKKVDLFLGGGITIGQNNVNFGLIDIGDINDPIITENKFSNHYFIRTSIGAFSKFKINNTKLFIGLSLLQINSFQPELTLTKAKHLFSNLGVLFNLSQKRKQERNQIYLELSIVMKYLLNTPTHTSGTARVIFDFNEFSNNTFSLGLGYSSNKRLQINSVLLMKKIGFGIIWDVISISNEPINHFGNFNTFEIRTIIPF